MGDERRDSPADPRAWADRVRRVIRRRSRAGNNRASPKCEDAEDLGFPSPAATTKQRGSSIQVSDVARKTILRV